MADDDEVVPVWYLCGWAYVLMDDHEAAREPLETALQVGGEAVRRSCNGPGRLTKTGPHAAASIGRET